MTADIQVLHNREITLYFWNWFPKDLWWTLFPLVKQLANAQPFTEIWNLSLRLRQIKLTNVAMAGFFQTVRSAFSTSGLDMAPYTVLRTAEVYHINLIIITDCSFRIFSFTIVTRATKNGCIPPRNGSKPKWTTCPKIKLHQRCSGNCSSTYREVTVTKLKFPWHHRLRRWLNPGLDRTARVLSPWHSIFHLLSKKILPSRRNLQSRLKNDQNSKCWQGIFNSNLR